MSFLSTRRDRHQRVWRPGGRFFMIAAPLLVVMVLLSIVALQLLHQLQVRAVSSQEQHLLAFSGAFAPVVAHSQLVGPLDRQEEVHLSLGLAPRNRAELERDAQAIGQGMMRPLTPEQYSQRFSPDAETYQAVQNYLKANGFTVTRTYQHRLMIDFKGSVDQAERSFHVAMNTYRQAGGRTFYANSAPPRVPAWLADELVSVNGLSDSAQWRHPRFSLQPQVVGKARRVGKSACPGASDDAFLPSEIARAYNLDQLYRMGYQGKGQTIAVFSMASFNRNDLQAYMQCFGRNRTRIEAIVSGAHRPTSGDTRLETELDAEQILSMAPLLDKLKIYETANNEADYLAQWSRIVQDRVPIVTISWGQCEAEASPQLLQQEHVLLQTAALQGQNIFAASGDDGSNSCDDSDSDKQLSVSDPDAQPFVTSVGGTSLDTDRQGRYVSETTWNNHLYRREGGNTSGATGGGISRYWTMPDWQRAPGVPDELYSSSEPCAQQSHSSGKYCRQVPDVALHADPHKGYWVYCTIGSQCDPDDPWTVVGGTSSAAPLWAVLMALVDEMSLRQHGHRIGFVTPLLYQVARDPARYATSFHDVTTGHSDYNDENQGLYPAGPGYDMATGLGSYNAPGLARNLVELAHQNHMYARR